MLDAQQSLVDSLKYELKITKDDTAKIIILNKLAMMLQTNMPETSLGYSEEALKISEDHNCFEHLPNTYSTLAAANWALGNYAVGLDFLFEKLKIHETKNEHLNIAKTYKHIAIILNDYTNKNKEILLQKNQISEQNEELRIQSEELILHEEHLKELVDERTKELIIAKEKAEESDKLKSAFLTNVSHEIRTPMNAIIGFSDILARSDISNAERDEYLGIIQGSSSKLLNLIDDIIDLSKIEVEKINIHKAEFALKEVMLDLLSKFSNQKPSQIELNYNYNENNDHISIYTDASRFKQILGNLLDNALKFTDSGQINFGYNIRNGQKIEFYVKDTGIGIPLDKQEMIFDRFRKIEDDNARLYKGTGLGLTISKCLTKMLGWEMWLDTDYENGSLFKFTLPYIGKT